MTEWGTGDRDADRCVQAHVDRILRLFTEGIQWIHRDYPEVLNSTVRERVLAELYEQLPGGFKPHELKSYKAPEWTKQ